MSKRHITYFNDQWIDDPRFSSWIEKCTERTNAKCCICQKNINLSTIGVSCLISQAAEKKRQKAQESNKVTIKTFMQPQQKSPSSEGSSESPISIPPRAASTSLNDYVKDANTTKAEILGTLKTVMSTSSLRSCEQLKHLFLAMFSDSTIAKSFTLGRTKCGYYITYGIAAYFGGLIKTLINKLPCFSLSFDETLNRV